MPATWGQDIEVPFNTLNLKTRWVSVMKILFNVQLSYCWHCRAPITKYRILSINKMSRGSCRSVRKKMSKLIKKIRVVLENSSNLKKSNIRLRWAPREILLLEEIEERKRIMANYSMITHNTDIHTYLLVDLSNRFVFLSVHIQYVKKWFIHMIITLKTSLHEKDPSDSKAKLSIGWEQICIVRTHQTQQCSYLYLVHKIYSLFKFNGFLWGRLIILWWKCDFVTLRQEGVKSQYKISMAFKQFLHSCNDTRSINSTMHQKETQLNFH